MKASEYNYILEWNEFSYWYNGIEHSFFKLPLTLGEKIKSLINSPHKLLLTNEVFYNKLADKGFIIGDDVDELNLIRKKNNDERKRKDYFLTILPTLNCNFKCWYCIQNHIPSMMSAQTIDKVKAHIDYMINVKQIKSLQLEWFGGEPFMFFQKVIKPISEYAMERCAKSNLPFYNSATTNAYYLEPTIVEELKRLQFKRFHVTLDGPQELHDKVKFQQGCPSAFQRTLLNIEHILNTSKDANILLRINYTHENLNNIIVNQINDIISPQNRNRITITPKRVWQEKVEESLFTKIDSLLKMFEIAGYNVIRLDIIYNFVTCYADREYYNSINFNGDIVKCTASDDLYTEEAPGHLNADGSIAWREGFKERFFKKRFENNKCLKCKYLPICMGMCPRNYNETEDNFYCKIDITEIEKSLISYIDSEYEKSH